MQLPLKTLISLLPYFLQVSALASGSGTTTRYWDCCKPSCAWSGKTTLAAGATPVNTCSISNSILSDSNTASACDGGSAYQCSNESPWAVDDNLAYGYAAVNIAGGTEESWCCACYELTFTSGAVAGKKMVVQATNTGSDLAANQFDLSIPGGGVGIFNACTAQYGAPSTGWGAQYGGISSRSDCDSFPAALKDGCYWRFDWFMGSDNPTVEYTQVACPAALTANTGCTRADDGSAPAAPSGSAVPSASSSTAVVPTSSSSLVAVAPTSSSTTADVAPVSVSSSAIIALTSTATTATTAEAAPLSSSIVKAISSSIVINTPSTTTTTSAEAVSETPITSGDGDGDEGNYCEL